MSTSVVFPPIGGTTYSVPADSEVNWASLSNYLIALASAQGTTSQKKAVRKCITTPVTVVSSSDAVLNIQLTTPGAVSVVLPISPQGQFYSIVDGTGDAATNNITITGSASSTINGSASYVISDNRASVDLIYITAANNWIAISNSSAVAKTLKQTYDTSIPARIALTSASGGLELRDAATPIAASLFKVADTTGGVAYFNVTSAGVTGSNLSGSNTGDQSLDALTNVSITSKQISDIVSWNGVAWVNGPQSTATGTGGVVLYNATPILIAASANCAIAVGTLAPVPVVTGDVNTTTALNANTVAVSAWLSAALGRTTISAGDWAFQSHLSVDSTAGGRVTSITRNTYRASPNQAGTVTVTGAGTTRTATASTGTPFATANITASATNTLAAYLKTPQGIFQISARTSDTVVTITVLAGYANEAAVAFSYWERLFGTSSSTITSITPVFQEINFNSLQGAFTCATTDAVGIITFGVSTGGAVTLTSVYNGTINHAFVTTPLAIRHNDLPNIQGGASNDYYHSTLAEYTGTGTGVFVRAAGASIGLASATGLPLTTGVTGVLPIANGGTNLSALPTVQAASTFAAWDANSNLLGNNLTGNYATTATAAGTTTLLVGSKRQQFFTGTTTQTVLLPVTSTLVLGQQFEIINLSTGLVSVKSSGSNIIQTMSLGTKLIVTCILTSGTTAASWSFNYASNTGSISGAGIKNYVSNPNDANSGWTASGGGIAVTTETTSSLFPDNITQSSAIKILRASGSDYVYTRWTMDQADYSILCGILFAMQYSGTAGDYTLALYTNTASNYGGSYVSVTLPTTSIPAASTGLNFQTNGVAGASGTQYMELRINGIAGTTALYLNAVTFTPNAPAQGAAISEWQSITFAVPSNLGAGSATNTAFFRRVGSDMQLRMRSIKDATPGSGASSVTFTMPTGYTIDTTKLANGYMGYGSFAGATFGPAIDVLSTSGTTFVIRKNGAATNITGADMTASSELQFQVNVPISEWAGNGTVNLGPGAQVEYASCAITSDADNSTTVYGPAGSLVPTAVLSTTRTATFTWQYPRQDSDIFLVEIQTSTTSGWMPFDSNGIGAVGYQTQNSVGYGLYLTHPSSTTSAVSFSRYARTTGVTFGSAGDNWSALTTTRWRVRKVTASSPVGFGLAATDGTAGLYKAGSVPGLTTGATIAAGYVGEVIIATATSVPATTATYNVVTSITVTAGVWLLTSAVEFEPAPTTVITRCDRGLSTSAGANYTGAVSNENKQVEFFPSYVPGDTFGRVVPTWSINVASGGTLTYYLKCYTTFGTSTLTISGAIRAVRIA